MVTKTILKTAHDIEEFLRSTESLQNCELLYTADTNRREKQILARARSRAVFSKSISVQALRNTLASYGLASVQRRIALVLIVPAERIGGGRIAERGGGGGRGISALWELLEGGAASGTTLVLILASIQDPQNLGAILRSADLFGVSAIVLPSRRSAELSETVRRASAGASHHLPIFTVPNLLRIVQELKKRNFWVYASNTVGTNIAEVAFAERTALILGNEGRGIAQRLLESADSTISIPMQGHVDSFNVSVAAGIMLYEIRRQQGFTKY